MTEGPSQKQNPLKRGTHIQHPQKNHRANKKLRVDKHARFEGSHDEILRADVRALLSSSTKRVNVVLKDSQAVTDPSSSDMPTLFEEAQVDIVALSSTGDGLGYIDSGNSICVVPFTAVGDKVLAKPVRHRSAPAYTVCDLVRVLEPASERDDALVQCKYFACCGGCQLQMLPYSTQLAHKREVVQKAYRNFSGLPQTAVPEVFETIGSPKEYGYRTKLTPHFDGPPGMRRAKRHGETPKFDHVPAIGFQQKGMRKTIDIEVCPIATATVQAGLQRERERVAREIDKYRRGATILLRESSERTKITNGQAKADGEVVDQSVVKGDHGSDGWTYSRRCISDNNATATEYVGDYKFENPANAFFQNNNSILPIFTQYIREHILPSGDHASDRPRIVNLIDAYCGSGLFTITLSSLFRRSIGIDISGESIAFAKNNAQSNGLRLIDESKSDSSDQDADGVRFISADAAKLFASVPSTFEARETAVVIDPPRKGCDENFLQQLEDYAPERIVYVSCNVHTQARDIGWLLYGRAGREKQSHREELSIENDDPLEGLYELESLRGFDFFPQTAHVESVAVLRRKSTSTK